MTSTLISRAAPDWLRELAMARTDYEEMFGWPVSLEVTARRLTLPAGQTVDAVTMPTALGALVQFQLRVMMLDGPVIAWAGRGRLTFLTDPSTSTHSHLTTDLEHARVRSVPRGEHVVLPIARAASDRGELRWFNPPHRCRRPPAWTVVVGASRRVLSRQTNGSSLVPDRLAA